MDSLVYIVVGIAVVVVVGTVILARLKRSRMGEREPAIKLEADVRALVNVTRDRRDGEMRDFDAAFNLGEGDDGEESDAQDSG